MNNFLLALRVFSKTKLLNRISYLPVFFFARIREKFLFISIQRKAGIERSKRIINETLFISHEELMFLRVANVKKRTAETGKRGKGAEMTKKPEARKKAGCDESEV